MSIRALFEQLNRALAVRITRAVGTMWCAYLFAILALFGLPSALAPGGIGVVMWFSTTFLQLVLLSILAVGQQTQADELESHRVAQTAHHARVERAMAAHVGRVEALHTRIDDLHQTIATPKPRTGRQRKESAP